MIFASSSLQGLIIVFYNENIPSDPIVAVAEPCPCGTPAITRDAPHDNQTILRNLKKGPNPTVTELLQERLRISPSIVSEAWRWFSVSGRRNMGRYGILGLGSIPWDGMGYTPSNKKIGKQTMPWTCLRFWRISLFICLVCISVLFLCGNE